MRRVPALPARPCPARSSCISSCARIPSLIEGHHGRAGLLRKSLSGYRGVPRLRRGAPSVGGFGGLFGAPHELKPEGEASGRGWAFDPERDVPDAFGVDIGPEDLIPDRQAGPEIGTMMLRAI